MSTEQDLDLQILPPEHRISPEDLLKSIEDGSDRHLLVDVRSESEFHMCKIDGSTNYPIESLTGENLNELMEIIKSGKQNYFKKSIEEGSDRHLLVDGRSESEFHMCNIDGSTNYPIEILTGEKLNELMEIIKNGRQTTFICRRGNDSQLAAQQVLSLLPPSHRPLVRDLHGGLHAWAHSVDTRFPRY